VAREVDIKKLSGKDGKTTVLKVVICAKTSDHFRFLGYPLIISSITVIISILYGEELYGIVLFNLLLFSPILTGYGSYLFRNGFEKMIIEGEYFTVYSSYGSIKFTFSKKDISSIVYYKSDPVPLRVFLDEELFKDFTYGLIVLKNKRKVYVTNLWIDESEFRKRFPNIPKRYKTRWLALAI